MDDMYTRNSGSMHDELIQRVSVEILLLMDSDEHTDREIEFFLDAPNKVIQEALDYLVSKGLLWEYNHNYGVPSKVQDEIDRICQKAVETLVRTGI